jgi:hypothetical protein
VVDDNYFRDADDGVQNRDIENGISRFSSGVAEDRNLYVRWD